MPTYRLEGHITWESGGAHDDQMLRINQEFEALDEATAIREANHQAEDLHRQYCCNTAYMLRLSLTLKPAPILVFTSKDDNVSSFLVMSRP